MIELLTAIVLFGAVAALIMLFARWTKEFSDLLWMLSLRSTLVAVACLVVSGVIWGVNRQLFGLPPLSPTSFLIVLALAPIAAVPAADACAYWVQRLQSIVATPDSDHKEAADLADDTEKCSTTWRGFIFAQERRRRSDAYEAPPIEP